MSDSKLTGGTEEDRKEILQLHERYIDVNTRFDWEGLTPIYSPSSEATYFNLNGHTYNGRDHWISLWKFYGQNVASTYWTPFDIGGDVTGEVAVVWCHRKTRRQWTGKEPPPRNINYDNTEFISRSTMVFRPHKMSFGRRRHADQPSQCRPNRWTRPIRGSNRRTGRPLQNK